MVRQRYDYVPIAGERSVHRAIKEISDGYIGRREILKTKKQKEVRGHADDTKWVKEQKNH